MNLEILEAFENIPAANILEIALKTQRDIVSDPSQIKSKDGKQSVTQADLDIQRVILNYFAKSSIAGKYIIRAEEQLNDHDLALNTSEKPWQLIIDPLDGTSSFCRGEKTWGSMVGLCDRQGKIIYSWNLLSTGEIFSSHRCKQSLHAQHILNDQHNSALSSIDFYDYGAGNSQLLAKNLEKISSQKYKASSINTTSFPAAIWAGWNLFNQSADALLWLPSTQGKGIYPDYDLIFLGALAKQGWKIRLGKSSGAVHLVAVARNDSNLNLLWDCAKSIVGSETIANLSYESEPIITNAVST